MTIDEAMKYAAGLEGSNVISMGACALKTLRIGILKRNDEIAKRDLTIDRLASQPALATADNEVMDTTLAELAMAGGWTPTPTHRGS